MDKITRKRLAGHIQAQIHAFLPGYYFSAEDVDDIIEEFLKIDRAPDKGQVKDVILQALYPSTMPDKRQELRETPSQQLYELWKTECEKR